MTNGSFVFVKGIRCFFTNQNTKKEARTAMVRTSLYELKRDGLFHHEALHYLFTLSGDLEEVHAFGKVGHVNCFDE